MSDIYDVQVVLSQLAQQAVYPNGLSSPSIANCDVRIFPGWPLPNTLDSDLTNRKAQISIFPSNMARATTRFQTLWDTVSINEPTLSLNVNNNQISVDGAVSTPQSCMVFVNSIAYSYGVLPDDTLESIAAGLAAEIPYATAIGNVVTVGNNPYYIFTRVIVAGQSVRELAREMRMMFVTIWAPTPQIRSIIGNAVNVLFSATYRPVMPDGTYAQLSYSGSREEDLLEKVKCYRRDLHFIVEYAITQTESNYSIGSSIANISDQNDIPAPQYPLLQFNDSEFLLL